MELIDNIIKAERQAAEIRRRAEEEAERIARGARSNSEILLSMGKRGRKLDREFAEALARRRAECAEAARREAGARRAEAEARVQQAVDFVVKGILEGDYT